jgi:hypothetical protein
MAPPLRRFLLVCLLSLLLAAPAGAWSFKEHILVTRLAVQRLLADPATPPEMKAWLQEICPTAGDAAAARTLLVETYVGPEPVGLEKLDYWCIFPDIARKVDGDRPAAPFGVPEAPMHFVDLELLLPGDEIKQYRHDLSNKPRFEDLPRDWRDPRLVQAGYLPWRVQQIYDALVQALREKRLAPADLNDRDNALVLAGYLAHYLGDNTQPQHATIDFRSRAYFAIPQRAPDVHGMLEYGMLDMEGRPYPELREELWARLAPLAPGGVSPGPDHPATQPSVLRFGTDPWESTARISLEAYDALPLVGTAAQEASGQAVEAGDPSRPVGAPALLPEQFDIEVFFRHRGMVRGQEKAVLDVKAEQLTLAVLRIELMLRQAWDEAHGAAGTTTRSTTHPVAATPE